MPDNSPREAIQHFSQRIGNSLRCVADFHIFVAARTDRSGALYLKPYEGAYKGKSGGALGLRGSSGRVDFYLDVLVTYEVVASQSVQASSICVLTGYSYILSDLEGKEIVVFQWAPLVSPPFQFPHMHVSAAGRLSTTNGLGIRQEYDLGNFHFPTGQVPIEDVIELLIREFSIEPKRPDWERALAMNRVST